MAGFKTIEGFESALRELANQTHRFHYAEFLAHQALIQDYLDKGFTAKVIWEVMTQKKIISFKYPTLTRYLRKHPPKACKTDPRLETKVNDARLKADLPSVTPAQDNSQLISDAGIRLNLPNGMSHNPKINPKDLI